MVDTNAHEAPRRPEFGPSRRTGECIAEASEDLAFGFVRLERSASEIVLLLEGESWVPDEDDVTVWNKWIEYPEEGTSSKDLFTAIGRARLSGSLHIHLRDPMPGEDQALIYVGNVDVAVRLIDLYDFNYFNDERTSGVAARVQEGWEEYEGP